MLGDKVYSDEDDTLEATVGRLLKASGKTLSAAESCTGGEISFSACRRRPSKSTAS